MRKALLATIIVFTLVSAGIVLAVTYTGFGPIEQPFIMFDDSVCGQEGTYCHLYNVNNGTINISFPSVASGTFNYTIEG